MASVARTKYHPEYGRGVASADYIDAKDVLAVLERALKAPDYKPPVLPRAAAKMHQLTSDPNCDVQQILSLLSEDTQMVGRILKLMQSPMYGGAAKILSLRQALARLGLRGLRDVVFQVALESKVFRNKTYQGFLDRLQSHSVACAHVAKVICARAGLDSDHAFLCGLMHDVGVAGAVTALSEQYGKKGPSILAVWSAVEQVHGAAGARMVESWGLPAEVAKIVNAHEHPGPRGQEDKMAAAICVANHLAINAGLGLFAEDEAQDPDGLCQESLRNADDVPEGVVRRACIALGFTAADLAELQAQAEQMFAQR